MHLPFTPRLPRDTARLTLRAVEDDDLEALLAYHSSPEATRFVPFAPRDRDGMAAWLQERRHDTRLRDEGDRLQLVVVEREEARLVGDVLLVLRSIAHQTAEIGFMLDPRHQGRGYATEAARELVELAFRGAGIRRLVARADARNRASQRVCERLGMRREAELVENEWFKGELTSEVDYGLLAREWP